VTGRRVPDTLRTMSEPSSDPISGPLLHWYDRHRRVMPWRALPGQISDPYHVWLSEIMLQQTTVATVGSYFERFRGLWPTIGDLATAELDEVLHAWQGLGYYARARNLHKCAKVVATEFGGVFPDIESDLLKLPGIGPYTAAAIAAIAFGRKATVVDGNVERVIARLFAVEDPLPGSKDVLRDHAAALTPDERCGDYAQAVMDLGATICSPRNPACGICPLVAMCGARRLGIEADLPKKSPKAERPTRRGVAFWIVAPDGAVLLRRRVESGLLGGMMEVPSTDWVENGVWTEPEALKHAPVRADWHPVKGLVRHTFTHFHLELTVLAARVEASTDLDGVWCAPRKFSDFALPTVMKKIVRLAVEFGPVP
jgi:A/G-specific adenine glycosylase